MVKCTRCKENISETEKRVRITTFMEDKTSVDGDFHWQCWQDEFKGAVKKKLEHVQESVVKTAGSVVKKLLDEIKGTDDWVKKETEI